MWQENNKGKREGFPWYREWGETGRWGDWEELGEVGERPSWSFGGRDAGGRNELEAHSPTKGKSGCGTAAPPRRAGRPRSDKKPMEEAVAKENLNKGIGKSIRELHR